MRVIIWLVALWMVSEAQAAEFPITTPEAAISIVKKICTNTVSPTAEWHAELDAQGRTWSVTTLITKGGDVFIDTDVPVNGPIPAGCSYGTSEPTSKN
jgi:hypothetical protein